MSSKCLPKNQLHTASSGARRQLPRFHSSPTVAHAYRGKGVRGEGAKALLYVYRLHCRMSFYRRASVAAPTMPDRLRDSRVRGAPWRPLTSITLNHHEGLALSGNPIDLNMDDLRRLLQQGGGLPGMGQGAGLDEKVMDTAEVVQISSLALLKILKHARAGVPMEVMGLMLGSFVDDYTIQVVDVFSMPQSGTGVSVEAVDEVYQQHMMEMLAQTGRPENVVGWYHSHPGFGPWLSGVDIQTQQSFERLHARAAAVVVDPIQSVK